MKLRVILLSLSLIFMTPAAHAVCNDRFLNPISEICWDCILPITIGGFTLYEKTKRPDTKNQRNPFCLCSDPLPRVGLSIGLWEPSRLVDVANEAGCFVNLGFQIDMGLYALGTSSASSMNGTSTGSIWQAHYYFFPLISWLGIIVDGLCLQNAQFDIAYLSEFDPLWQDPELANLINPEGILFANPIAQSACAADCALASSGKLGLDKLFWCTGCGGGIYPIQGASAAHDGAVMASNVIAVKTVARMHRLLLARRTASNKALCSPKLQPVINKSQYRFQITRPIAKTKGRWAGGPTGFSTHFIAPGREFPFKGESFGWLIWRKRNCCAL